MGASESTAKANSANEEEERQQHSTGASVATAAAGVAAVGMAVWGIAKMVSDSQQKQAEHPMTSNSSLHESYSIPRPSLAPPPPSNSGRRFKMSTDGACRPNQGRPCGYMEDGSVMRGPSGYGGILRDERGKWVRDFRGFINDQTDCLTAEFHGILKGLQLLDKLGFVGSYLESDSAAAIEWVTQDLYRRRSEVIQNCWDIITECKRLKNKNRITVGCCMRNDNKSADKLANMAIDKREAYVELINLPDEIKDIVAAESAMF